MAKKEESPLELANKHQDSLSPSNAAATAGEVLEAFEQIDESQLQGLTAEYIRFKEETTYNFIASAMTTFTSDNGQEVEAVELYDKEGTKYINGNAVLVKSVKKVTQFPCYVRVVTGKKTKGSNGEYLAMEVYVLPKSVDKV